MKVAFIAVIGSIVLLFGCANNKTFRAGGTGGSGGSASPVPDSTPSLGNPAPFFGSPGNSSSYGPSRGGPSLGLPEARGKSASPDAPRSARLQAPEPQPRTSGYRPKAAAEAVSSAERPSILDEPTWSRFYRSTDLRPIESLIVGSGPARIAIFSSMHGDETQSVGLVEELARSLRRRPEHLKEATVLLVKSPNPDGYFGHSPYNTHGVDLNRNFPSANWKELKNTRAGDRAGSETETQVVVRLLRDFHPDLVVHLKDSRNTSIVNYEGEIEKSAQQIASLISCQVVQGLGEKTSGSVENYAETQLACPSLTLLLARESSDEAAWARNHDALLALLGVAQPGRASEGASRSIDDQPDPFEDLPVHKSSLRRQRPADQTNRSRPAPLEKPQRRAPLPDFPAAVPDHGYLELPAP